MKKRLMSAAIAAVVLMALFAACGEEVQTVANETAKQVGTITVTQLAKNYKVLVSWDAVEDGTAYRVYAQVDGKNTVLLSYPETWGWNQVTVSNNTPESEDVKYTPNASAVDNYVCVLDVQYIYTDYDYSWDATAGKFVPDKDADGKPIINYTNIEGKLPSGKVRFGVQTHTAKPNQQPSEIKWSDPVDIKAPANKDNIPTL